MSNFPNFDELLKMARENPEQLEQLRQQEVEKLINNSAEENRQRLRGLQFQIDAQRKIHKHSPMGAVIKLSKMMNASFDDMRQKLTTFTGVNDPLCNDPVEVSRPSLAEAKVLSFPR